jgi:hypothetical protein
MLDVADVQARSSDDNIVKLDVRDIDEWIAESSSPYGKDFCPRKGRIPGAKWIEWYRMMKPTPEGPMIKSQGRDPRGMRDRRHHAGNAGLHLLLQGRPRLQHLPGAQGSGRRRTCASISAPGTSGRAIRRCRSRKVCRTDGTPDPNPHGRLQAPPRRQSHERPKQTRSMSEPILIVGAGQAGIKAAETLRQKGYDGDLVLIGDEALACLTSARRCRKPI